MDVERSGQNLGILLEIAQNLVCSQSFWDRQRDEWLVMLQSSNFTCVSHTPIPSSVVAHEEEHCVFPEFPSSVEKVHKIFVSPK